MYGNDSSIHGVKQVKQVKLNQDGHVEGPRPHLVDDMAWISWILETRLEAGEFSRKQISVSLLDSLL